jgi:dihydrofolate reductase
VSKLRCSITMSLDGYVAGSHQSEENPLGVGGLELHEWFFPLKEFREMEGGTTFYFVSDGIESALAQAKDAAAGRDVWLAGGASVVNQALAARLVDEIDISIAPVMIGAGERLFDGVGHGVVELKQIRDVDAPGVTHIKYEVN